MRWLMSVFTVTLVGLPMLFCDCALAQGSIVRRQQPSSHSRGDDTYDSEEGGSLRTGSGNSCVSLSRTPAGNDVYITNKCNRAIVVKFCWNSSKASCSCSRNNWCGTSSIAPGSHEMVTGPGHDGDAIMRDSVCDYREWVAGRCKL